MPADFAFPWMLVLLPILGFAVGLFVSVVGGGGGLFYVPLLTLLLNIPTQLAAATSLASILPTTISGSISHHRRGNVNLPMGAIFGIGGIAGAIIGAYVSSLIPSEYMSKLFGFFMIGLGIPMIISSRSRAKRASNKGQAQRSNTWLRTGVGSLFGFLSGVMSGLLGTSGTPPAIAGLYILGFPAPVVIGTSVFVLFFNSLSGLVGHMVLSQFDAHLVLPTAFGAVIGASLGPKVLATIKPATLEKVYGPLIILLALALGIAMILK